MLKIWYYSGTEYMNDAPSYFDNVYEDEWIEDEFVKEMILMLKDDSFVYNLSNCGNNCAKWVLKIAEKKDLVVYLQHMIRFEGEFEIQIMNTGKIVHDRREYVDGLLEAEAMQDEG